MIRILPLLAANLVLAACGGGASHQIPPPPPGREVVVEGFETYRTNHNGFDRVRRDLSRGEDAEVISGFEDSDPADPAGYRNLIALDERLYGGRMQLEVLAEMRDPGTGEVAHRLLRLTADQAPLERSAEGGRFHLRGANFIWAQIDDGPLIAGQDARGLVDMVVDFDSGTADLSLRTGVGEGSELRSLIEAEGLPFNVRTGAYGGDVAISIWDPEGADILEIDGALRGSLGGDPSFENSRHGLSTSGLYTGDGVDPETGRRVRVEGAFVGIDPNALPPTGG